MPKVVEVKSHA